MHIHTYGLVVQSAKNAGCHQSSSPALRRLLGYLGQLKQSLFHPETCRADGVTAGVVWSHKWLVISIKDLDKNRLRSLKSETNGLSQNEAEPRKLCRNYEELTILR